jgi:hypothetical protein
MMTIEMGVDRDTIVINHKIIAANSSPFAQFIIASIE